MLLVLQQFAAKRPLRASALSSVAAPARNGRYVTEPLRADQASTVTVPAVPRQGGRPASTTDFAPVVLEQDARWPVFSRYLPVLPAVQRPAVPRPSRSYPDIYAGFAYPPLIEAPRGRSSTASRQFEPARTTDFALRRRTYQPGRRWNGMLFGMPSRTVTFRVPASVTYAQALGFAQVWASGGVVFPAQYFGLRTYYRGAVKDLCLVAIADAPAGMGGVPRVQKNGVTYAVYLVETSDPNASPVRFRTSAGTKAIREKT